MPAESVQSQTTRQEIYGPPGTPQMPMHYEGGMFVPGHAPSAENNIQISNNSSATANGNEVTLDGAAGGTATGNEALAETPQQPEEQPDELDALRQQVEERDRRIDGLEQQVQQMNERLQQIVELLRQPPPPETPQPPGSPPGPPAPGAEAEQPPQISPEQLAVTEASAEVTRLRDQLAQFTILRRARSFDFGTRRRREDAEAYENYYQQYNEAFHALQVAQANLMRANGNQDEEAIIDDLANREYAEQEAFAKLVFSKDQKNYEEGQKAGGLRALYERNLRKWANYSTKKKLLIGLGLAVGAGIASGTLGLGLFGIAAGVSARYSVGILNHHASARNVSEKSLNSEVMRIRRRGQRENLERMRRRSSLNLTEPEDVHARAFLTGTEERTAGYHSGEMGRARHRNQLGLAILGISGVLVGTGIAELAGVGGIPHFMDIPGIDSLWHHAHNLIPGSHQNGANLHNMALHNDTIVAHSPHEFMNGALGPHGLLERQGIHVHGLTAEKMAAITRDMQAHHWHIASGMGAAPGGGLHQHVVDVAKDWSGGHTGNWNASADQAFQNTAQLRRFMSLAQQHGVTFTRG